MLLGIQLLAFHLHDNCTANRDDVLPFVLLQLIVVRQRDKLEPVFQQYLMEDRGTNGSASYVDFLCHIHKEIRNLLS